MDNGASGGEAVLAVFVYIFVFMLLFWLSLFAAKDASKNRVPFIEKEYGPNDSVIWFFVCFLIFGLGFFYYFMRRNLVMEINGNSRSEPAVSPPIVPESKSAPT